MSVPVLVLFDNRALDNSHPRMPLGIEPRKKEKAIKRMRQTAVKKREREQEKTAEEKAKAKEEKEEKGEKRKAAEAARAARAASSGGGSSSNSSSAALLAELLALSPEDLLFEIAEQQSYLRSSKSANGDVRRPNYWTWRQKRARLSALLG